MKGDLVPKNGDWINDPERFIFPGWISNDSFMTSISHQPFFSESMDTMQLLHPITHIIQISIHFLSQPLYKSQTKHIFPKTQIASFETQIYIITCVIIS